MTFSDYQKSISNLFQRYLAHNPDELSRLQVLNKQLEEKDPHINDRKNMVGHLTASALVINEKEQCLLIRHKFLQRWLQPGGHMDAGETPLEGALRELVEETGVARDNPDGKANLTIVAVYPEEDLPVDVDSHKIPASATKMETEHLHHDFQYVFRLTGTGDIALDQAEVSDFKWVDLDEIKSGAYGERLARVAAKLQTSGRP